MQQQTKLQLFENGENIITQTTQRKVPKSLTQLLSTPVNTVTGDSTKLSLEQSLDTLFPEQQQNNKDIKKAKEILGALATVFPSEQLSYEVAKMQYLVNSWLDEFEKKTFDGLTLKELLHEKGGI